MIYKSDENYGKSWTKLRITRSNFEVSIYTLLLALREFMLIVK